MNLTRKRFCASMAGATVTLWLQGCGGGGGDSGTVGPPAGTTCGAGTNDISLNHGHTLTIPKADLDSATSKLYRLSPATDTHEHDVTFSPAQLASLKGGGTVTVTSVVAVGHSHQVTARVASTCA